MPEQTREQEQNQPGFLRTAIQSIGIFLLIQVVTKQLFGSSTPKAAVPGANAPVADISKASAGGSASGWSAFPTTISPLWTPGTPMDVSMYVSPSVIMPSLKSLPADALIFDEKNFVYGDWKENREIHKEFPVPKEVQENGTLYAHFYVAQSGSPMDPTAPDYDTLKAYHMVRPLTQYLPKKKVAKTRNLLAGSDQVEEEAEPEQGPTVVSYYHPNFTLSFIPDSGTQKFAQMHPAVRQFVQLERSGVRDQSGQNGWYYPILYVNTFWQLRDHMMPINSTVKTLPININLNNLKNWKFAMMASVDEGMKQNAQKAARGELTTGGDGSEFEEIKRVLLDSNIYLLATTGVVSVFHMIFEMLAFKNDVSHWRKKKDNVGTSVRTILANVLMQTIIFLYLMDNNENTSWMILFGQGMGIAIEAWKITKAVNVRIRPSPPEYFFPYTIRFEDKHQLSETEKKTQEYDEIAFKYLYVVAVPLLLAYAAYSLLYETHKSWYSFVITTLVGSVYAYGFLMMVPSLYINYRLKSVAHMPGKAMMYKFLNTFIDDLFAFTIKMPTLHRLATLRDDVIFFIYLYQSWKYKVDYSRVNEFGQGGDDDEEEVEEKMANQPLAAPADGDSGAADGPELIREGEAGEQVHAKATGKEGKGGKGRKRK